MQPQGAGSDWHADRLGPIDCQALRLADTDVYWATPDPDLASQAAEVLSEDERIQASRLRRPEDRLAYGTAHALKRLALARRLGVATDDLAFIRDDRGKPYLRDHRLAFNLSHCDGAVAVAVSGAAGVGVDIERAKLGLFDPTVETIAFRPQELAQLPDEDAAARADALLSLWTLREAFAKATGHGLDGPERQAWFDLKTLQLHDLSETTGSSLDWRFRVWRPRQDISLALAIRLAAA